MFLLLLVILTAREALFCRVGWPFAFCKFGFEAFLFEEGFLFFEACFFCFFWFLFLHYFFGPRGLIFFRHDFFDNARALRFLNGA